jgi:hypothetical protein
MLQRLEGWLGLLELRLMLHKRALGLILPGELRELLLLKIVVKLMLLGLWDLRERRERLGDKRRLTRPGCRLQCEAETAGAETAGESVVAVVEIGAEKKIAKTYSDQGEEGSQLSCCDGTCRDVAMTVTKKVQNQTLTGTVLYDV